MQERSEEPTQARAVNWYLSQTLRPLLWVIVDDGSTEQNAGNNYRSGTEIWMDKLSQENGWSKNNKGKPQGLRWIKRLYGASQWTIEEACLDRRCIFILYINNPFLNLNLEGWSKNNVCTHSSWIKRRYILGIKKEVGEKEKEMSENNEKERYIRP